MIRPTRPSHARLPLFAAAIWLSPLAALLLAAPPALAQADSEEELAELRRRGDDLQAAGQLEARGDHATSARLRAELGLAYQGAGRYLDAERHLQAALRAAEDPWIGAHRAGLELALELAGRHLGWVHIACSSPGLYVVAREGRDGRMPCGTALRVAAGTLALEARAPGRQSQRLSVEITAGARAEVDPSLGSHECAEEGTIHIGGAG
ncbi:MAG: hypothetical protein OEY14_13865, partial [Myxococcales bacterium]|nr:hypothetical protein [Myxococcales bacterium]